MIMTTLNFDFPLRVPSLNDRFSVQTRYLVGLYQGTCFMKRGYYDSYDRAVLRAHQLITDGFDARVIEIRNELMVVF